MQFCDTNSASCPSADASRAASSAHSVRLEPDRFDCASGRGEPRRALVACAIGSTHGVWSWGICAWHARPAAPRREVALAQGLGDVELGAAQALGAAVVVEAEAELWPALPEAGPYGRRISTLLLCGVWTSTMSAELLIMRALSSTRASSLAGASSLGSPSNSW